jgi:hypothetical protein
LKVGSVTRLPLVVIAAVLLLHSVAWAQGSAGSSSKLEPRFVVDIPTAGMIDKGSFVIDADFYGGGGLLFGFSAGIFDRVSVGLSYGGSRLIGGESPVMNDVPGINVKIRVLEESTSFPALALGFDTQGRDGYISALSRYAIKSPGFYAAASKNYAFLGYLSVHGGANYTLERADGDRDVNFFTGVEKTIGPFASLLLEYNCAFNDNGADAIGRGRGYVNAALRIAPGGGLTLGINLKDLIKNAGGVSVANRTFRIEFSHPF